MVATWTFPGTSLDRIVDGDSFFARVSRDMDYGFHIHIAPSSVQKFRLNGCNAAPLSTDSGLGARAFLEGLLAPAPFTLESVGPYKFGDEWMAEVTLQDGRRVTDVMIAEQWAAPWRGRGMPPLPPWPRTVG